MRITPRYQLSNMSNVMEALRAEYPQYEYKAFGLGSDPTIMVSKSPFVGVQVSLADNEITVQGTPPTVVTGNLLFVLSFVGVDVVLGLVYGKSIRTMEKNIGRFLKQKFG